jgi:transposase
VSAECVDQQGPLANQAFAHLQNHCLSLLRDRLYRHEMHPRSPCRLADSLGVIAIVLGALDVGFDVLRWNQTDLVAKRDQFASPMVSAATGFHGNLGGGKLREEGDELRAAEIDPQHWSVLLIDAMESEDRFGRVDGYAFILGHGRLRFWLFTAQFWHAMPWGRPPQHFQTEGEMAPTPSCYAVTGWRRTESGRPAINIRLSTATAMAASVCCAAKGMAHLAPLLERIQADESLPALARELFAMQAKEYAQLQAQIDEVEAKLTAWHKADECSRRLAKIPSVGPIGAMLLRMKAPDPALFQSGRQFAAWIGLTPKDHSTAGKVRLGVITRAGDEGLRSVLVVGATAVIRHALSSGKASPWLLELLKRKSPKLAAVALANKTARIAWKMMLTGETYSAKSAAAASVGAA